MMIVEGERGDLEVKLFCRLWAFSMATLARPAGSEPAWKLCHIDNDLQRGNTGEQPISQA